MGSTLLVAADMSQLELRISAFMSRDPVMMDILRSGRDMHCVTAQAVYGTQDEIREKNGGSITDAMRDTAKIANYESGYGGGAEKLIEIVEKMVLSATETTLTVPTIQEAREILKTHHRLYQQWWQWVAWTKTRAHGLGYSETAAGRRRYFPDINSLMDKYRLEAERAAVNHCIQGTAADMMKTAMVNISRDELMCSRGDMILQVHDEIVSIVQEEWVDWYKGRIQKHMELGQMFEPYVHLEVDVNSAFRWRDCHK